MQRQYPIKIYAIYKNQIPKMSFVQHDTEVNRIYFEFYDDINVPMTGITTAAGTVKRPDGNTYTYGSDAFVIEDNFVTFILPPSAVYLDGDCTASVSLYDSNMGRLTTQTFTYNVTPELISNTLIDETNEYPILTDLIRKTNNLKTVYETSIAGNAESLAYQAVLDAKKTFDTLEHKIDDMDSKTSANTSDISNIELDVAANKTSIAANSRVFINALNPPATLTAMKGDSTGAAGNGTDDLATLQAIHDYIVSNYSRGVIYLPYGIYRITGSFNWDVGKVSIEGAGAIIFADISNASTYAIVTKNSNTGEPYDQSTTYMKGIRLMTTANRCNGIQFAGGTGNIGASHISIENCDISTFNYGVQFAENSYLINFMKTDIHGCIRGIDVPSGTINAGEKFAFVGCAIYNNTGLGVCNYNPTGEMCFVSCSFDYNYRHFDIKTGRCFLYGCHIEANDHDVTPFLISGDGGAFVMYGGWLLLTKAIPHTIPYVFDCTTSNRKGSGVYLDGVFANNMMTTSNKWASGSGTVVISNLMSNDTTNNPIFVSDAHNKLQDGSFEQASISDNIFIYGDTAAITNKLTGTNIALSRSTAYARTYSGSLDIHKTYGGGSTASLMIAVPIRDKSSILNAQLYYKKPGAETGTVYISTSYVNLGSNSSGVPTSIGSVVQRSAATVNLTASALDWTLFSDGEPHIKCPDWATHYCIMVNMDSFVGPGDFYIDDILITEM